MTVRRPFLAISRLGWRNQKSTCPPFGKGGWGDLEMYSLSNSTQFILGGMDIAPRMDF